MSTTDDGQVLYAGKFKTVEELEAGYKNSLPVFQENQTLKAKLDEVTKLPDEYTPPADISLHESDLEEVKRLAKESGLTQAQFEKLALQQNAKAKAKHEAFEKAKHELGADTLNTLQDYVKKYYPEKIGDSVLKKLIMEKDAREIALQHRNSVLNSKVPGISDINPGRYAVTREDLMKARDLMEKSRGKARVDAQRKYVSLSHQFAHQEKGA